MWEDSVLSRCDRSLRWLDVCTCTETSVRRQGSREVLPFRSIAADVVLECSSSDENEVSPARRESRADFPDVSLQLLGPSEWSLARTVISSARKTSSFLIHVPACLPSSMRGATIRRQAS